MNEFVPAEIFYEDGERSIQSDIDGNINDPKWRSFLHECLDEWLNKSNGSGGFYVGHVYYPAEEE